MIPGRILTLLLAGACNSVFAGDAPVSWYTTFNSHTFSEPTSIDSVRHDFRGDIRSGERAYTLNRFETGIRYGAFTVGYGLRYDYLLRFSEDTARAYHASTRDEKISSDQRVYLEASHIRAQGPSFGFQWQPKETITTSVKVNLLNADDMVEGTAKGNVRLTDADEYEGAINFLVDSSEDLLLEMSVPNPRGKGIAVDLSLDWAITDKWRLALNIQDLYSKFKWQDVLYSDLQADTATVTFDPNGNLATKPVLSGYQYLQDTTQKLPIKYQANLSYQINNTHSVYLQPFYVPTYVSQWEAGYQYTAASGSVFGVYCNPVTRALGVTSHWHFLSFRAGADSLDGTAAMAWDLAIGLEIPFQ